MNDPDMSQPTYIVPYVFRGRFFKNNPKYGWFILSYIILLVVIFVSYVAGVPPGILSMCMGSMILLAIVALIITRGKISLYELDKRELVITDQAIIIGAEIFPVLQLDKIAFYIHSYEGFRFKMMWNATDTSYGAENRIYFVTREGKKFEYKFLIPDENAFVALYWILDDWLRQGVRYGLKEVYGREFILNEISGKRSL